MDRQDVIVVGAGNAALCAALSAREEGARVTVLERAPVAERGGNSTFTAGAIRVPHRSGGDLARRLSHLSPGGKATPRFGPPTADPQFFHFAARAPHPAAPRP